MSTNPDIPLSKLRSQGKTTQLLFDIHKGTPIKVSKNSAPQHAPDFFPVKQPPRASISVKHSLFPVPDDTSNADDKSTDDIIAIKNLRAILLGDQSLPGFVPESCTRPPPTHCANDASMAMLDQFVKFLDAESQEQAKNNTIEGGQWFPVGNHDKAQNPRLMAEWKPVEDGTVRIGPVEGSSCRIQPGYHLGMAGNSSPGSQPVILAVCRDNETGALQSGVAAYKFATSGGSEKIAEIVASEMLPENVSLVMHVVFLTSNDGMHRGMTTYREKDGDYVCIINTDKNATAVPVDWCEVAFNPAQTKNLSQSGLDSFATEFFKLVNKPQSTKARKPRGAASNAKTPEQKYRLDISKFLKTQQMTSSDDMIDMVEELVKDRNEQMAKNGPEQSARETAFVAAWNQKGFVASMLLGRKQPTGTFMYVTPSEVDRLNIDASSVEKGMIKVALHYSFLRPMHRRNMFWELGDVDESGWLTIRNLGGTVKKFQYVEGEETDCMIATCALAYGNVVPGVGPVQPDIVATTVSTKTLAVQSLLTGITFHDPMTQPAFTSKLYFFLSQLQSPSQYGTLPEDVKPETYHDALFSALLAVASVRVGEVPSVVVDASHGRITVSDPARDMVLDMASKNMWHGPIGDVVRAIANVYAAKVGDKESSLIDPSPPASSSHRCGQRHTLGTPDCVRNIVARIAAAYCSSAVQEISNPDSRVLALPTAVLETEKLLSEFWTRPLVDGGFKLPSMVNVGDIVGKFDNSKRAEEFSQSSDKMALLFLLSVVMSGKHLRAPGSIFDVRAEIIDGIIDAVNVLLPNVGDIPETKIDRVATRLMHPLFVGLSLQDDPKNCIPEDTSLDTLISTFVEIKSTASKPRKKRGGARSAGASAPRSADTVESSDSETDSSDDDEPLFGKRKAEDAEASSSNKRTRISESDSDFEDSSSESESDEE